MRPAPRVLRRLKPGLRRVAPLLAIVLVGMAGAWIAALVAGRAGYVVGPFRVELFARPGPGITEIALPPFGRIRADTHLSPLKLSAALREVGAEELTSVVRRKGVDGLALEVEEEGLAALRRYAWRSLAVGAAGAAAAGLLVYRRRWPRVVAAGLAGALLLAGAGGLSWATYRPEAFLRPTFTGSLTLAPRLVGPLQEATGRIEDFRAELERLVSGAVLAYSRIAGVRPAAQSDVVVLHISDIHLSPIGLDLAQRLASSFEVDLVVDTGDLTSFGSRLEEPIVERIGDFDVPYVFVRGNHDSPETARTVAAQPNATVLSHSSARVAGLMLYGAPDPLFTPDESRDLPPEAIAAAIRAAGMEIAEGVAAAEPPPDVLLVHDDRMAEEAAGLVPLVLSGHFHSTGSRVIDETRFLRVGSTGGGGLEAFARDGAEPLAAQVLYLDGTPLSLLAWDAIELDPITQDLTIRRHLPEEMEQVAEPTPAPAESP